MLFMVIEHFKRGDSTAIGERFARSGRMLPDGITYHASWMDSTGTRCFQIMEARKPELLNVWASNWNDLVDFEFIPILTSAEFWARKRLE